MRKRIDKIKEDDLRPEYDLGELLRDGTRGKYAKRYGAGTNVVLLDRDVAEEFHSGKAVNEALRLVIQMAKLPRGKKRGAAK